MFSPLSSVCVGLWTTPSGVYITETRILRSLDLPEQMPSFLKIRYLWDLVVVLFTFHIVIRNRWKETYQIFTLC